MNTTYTDEEARHVSSILKHYAHAKEKHPYFCDIVLPDFGSSLRKKKEAYACALRSSRISIVAEIHNNTLSWETLIDCEIWEVLNALINGDTAHAIEELHDCIAVCLRTIDVLEGRQKLGRPETKGEGK